MKTLSSGDFPSHRQWFDAVIDEDVILCYASALEALGAFGGAVDERRIDVYALKQGSHENISYHLVESFDSIEHQTVGRVRCTTFTQTVADLLRDVHIDREALTEALAWYYFSHGESFKGLDIPHECLTVFEEIGADAAAYFDV